WRANWKVAAEIGLEHYHVHGGLTTEPTFQTRPKPLNHNLRRFMKESWFRPVALASAAILAIGVTFAIGA
ncbi:hypothetical protein J8J23_20865, partial [Mycobacterium tuberculosis]|uniref:hypothetical protein n=1 Tax=Mycobacterium tuberculosis TaxID=1773 RepID=UPI001AE0DC72